MSITLIEQFIETAKQYASKAAVIHNSRVLTYQELYKKAGGIARSIVKENPQSLVILVEQGMDMIPAMMGAFISGITYIPLDPGFPSKRIQDILEDSGSSLILSNEKNRELAKELAPEMKLLILEDIPEGDFIESNVKECDPAYIMYTSGSTGKPKGVIQSYENIHHFAEVLKEDLLFEENDRLALFSSYTHAVGILDIMATLLSGGTLYPYDVKEDARTEDIIKWMRDKAITVHHSVPTLFRFIFNELEAPLEDLRLVVLGGEAVTKGDVKLYNRFCSEECYFVNLFGCSELLVSTMYPMNQETPCDTPLVPMGHPVEGVDIELLGEDGNEVPLFHTGEIIYESDYLFSGYWQKGGDLKNLPGKKSSFSSGDLAKADMDEILEYQGRKDYQIKIRGQRVEPGEVEYALTTLIEVESAVVVSGEGTLSAYIVPSESEFSESGIRSRLENLLPSYMIPSAMMPLKTLPLTATGKVDRKALPPINTREKIEAVTAPVTPLEKEMQALWEEVLGCSPVGTDQNFFSLGGQSLKAMTLINRIEKKMGYRVPLKALSLYPTIKELTGSDLLKKGVSLPELKSEPDSRYEPFSLTDVQQAYLVGRDEHYEMGGVGTHTYNEVFFDELDTSRLENAINAVVEAHDMLKMVITDEGEQRILKNVPKFHLEARDMRGKEKEFYTLREEMSHQLFTGKEWPLFDFKVSRLEQGWKLHISLDALVMDISSNVIFFKEIQKAYEGKNLTPPKVSFRDYVKTEEVLKESELYRESRNYWKKRVPLLPQGPDLPLALQPSELEKNHFSKMRMHLSGEEWKLLQEKITRAGITETTFLTHCFGEVLNTWCKGDRFLLNLTLFNRLPFHDEVKNIIGDFTSLTLLEMDFSHNEDFLSRLSRVQNQLWEDLEHKYYSGVEVQRDMSREKGETVTIPVVITSTLGIDMNHSEEPERELSECEKNYSISQTPQVWLDCQITQWGEGLQIDWDVVEELFPEGMLHEMFTAFIQLFNGLIKSDWKDFKPELLPPAHREIKEAANSTEKERDLPLMYQLFEKNALKNPEKRAVKNGDTCLSYRELRNLSHTLGNTLFNKGAKTGELIALIMHKGWEQVAGALGIQYSGAAYMPVDASLPEERILKLLELGEVKQVVSVTEVINTLNLPEEINITDISTLKPEEPSKDFLPRQNIDDLAYVIFTSGSTGEPKGVMIDHKGAMNTILDINERFNTGINDSSFALSSMSFDLSVYDVFGMLSAGGEIIIPEARHIKDPQEWRMLLEEEGVTLWNSVPALMAMLADGSQGKKLSLRNVLLSGDWIPVDLPAKIQTLADNVNITSLGGATEASIWSIHYPVTHVDPSWKSIPYGKPLLNQTFHIFHTSEKGTFSECPLHVPGDLYIGGTGLALGYWKDDKKTASSFINHPETGERLYKTGDLGRYMPDGNIEFLGREDAQVKVQGYRIELGEIEAALKSHSQIHDAVADAVKSSDGTRQLAAWIVPSSSEKEVGDLVHAGNTVVDKKERTLFKLAQHGLRKVSGEKVDLKLSAKEITLKVYENSEEPTLEEFTAVTKEELRNIFSVLSAEETEGPLPKYLYPSAGSLYPVQTYLALGENACTGVLPGIYYFHPVEKLLIRLSKKADTTGAKLFFIGKTDAIEPMYGIYSHEFMLLEAGYITQLITSALDNRRKLADFNGNNHDFIKNSGLDESHTLLGAYSLESCKRKPGREISLNHKSRKSYRSYAGKKISENALKKIKETAGNHSDELDIFLTVKTSELMKPGNYKLNKKSLKFEFINNSDAGQIFTGSEGIYTDASLALYAVGTPCEKNQFQSGVAGMALMNSLTEDQVGFCAIGIVNQDKARNILGLSEDHQVIHSFTAGPVSGEQMEASTSDQKDFTQLLKSYLEDKLPGYMIPGTFSLIESVPLTGNGKINRKALPSPEEKTPSAAGYREAETPVEEVLVTIWKEVLETEHLGTMDNFFEMGGHSLKATRVISRINKELGVNVPLRDMFQHPTVKALAENISSCTQSQWSEIPLADKAEHYPLSHAQRRLWLIDSMDEDNIAYNIPEAYRIRGEFNTEAFENARNYMMERHESLRTIFTTIGGEPRQKILFNPEWPMELKDLSHATLSEEDVISLAGKDAETPFDLAQGPLIRFSLFKLAQEDHLLLFNMHHIISDVWSMGVFAREFFGAYNLYRKGESPADKPLKIQYKDYSLWQKNQEMKGHREYWHNKLTGELPVLNLPGDRTRPAVQSYRGATHSHLIPKELCTGLNSLVQQKGSSLFMGVTALVNTLLYRYTGQTDIIMGSPTAGRIHKDLEEQIGFYVNTMVLRNSFKGEISFCELLDSVRETCTEAMEHQSYPFDSLVEELNIPRDMSRSPLFDVMVVLQNNRDVLFKMDGAEMEHLKTQGVISKFDITFSFYENHEGLHLQMEYNRDIYNKDRMARMALHLETLLRSALEDGTKPLNKLSLLTEEEKNLYLKEFNNTHKPFDSEFTEETTIVSLFEKVAEKHPGAKALIHREHSLTYGELNARANSIAHTLLKKGLKKEQCVAVVMERSLQWITALLGIMKAGGAYVPVDPAYPKERIKAMSEECFAVMDSGSYSSYLHETTDNPSVTLKPDNLAYVIYTSGSTGKPKGTLLEHRGFVNMSLHQTELCEINEHDVVLQFASHCFDASLSEIFMALFKGAALCIADKELIQDLNGFENYLKENSVTVATLPPAYLKELTDLSSLKTLITAGEKARPEDVKHYSGKLKYINGYGPTEASVAITHYIADPDKEYTSVPIGKPVNNTEIYIVDEHDNPVPLGVPGELVVSGMGLARGYKNNRELTESLFTPNPFGPGRIYRTGDLAMWLPEGNIEFLGRKDHQVKVRGYRIELAEIETILASHNQIGDAVVLPRKTRGATSLTGYYTLKEGTLEKTTVKNYLADYLPDYMIPDFLTEMEHFPVTANGKIDREALPAPEAMDPGQYTAPVTDLEKRIQKIWQETLELEAVSTTVNFFDLGGNSLKAIQLISKTNALLESKATVASLFKAPTVKQFARELTSVSAWTPLVPVKPAGSLPPVYCLPIAGGNVDSFMALSGKLGDRPVYAFQHSGLDEGTEALTSVEAIAEQNLEAMLKHGVEEPVYLAGLCFGGNVAIEMANRLEAMGKEIGGVYLFDTYAPDSPHYNTHGKETEREFFTRNIGIVMQAMGGDIPLHPSALAEAKSIKDCFLLVNRNIQPRDHYLARMSWEEYERFFTTFKTHSKALLNYRPQVKEYSYPVTLYRVENNDWPNLSLDWDKIVLKNLHIEIVPGGHFTMLQGHVVGPLAEHMAGTLSPVYQ